MNKLFTPAVRITFALLGLAVILGTAVSTFNYERSAQAAYNAEINYQGKLTNASNVAVADGDYNMEFKLYDAVSGGSLLWTETRTGSDKVTVTNGVFSVMLGEVNAFGSLDFNQTLFLSVNIGGTGSPSWDGEMTPRKKIGTVPVAFLASNLKGTGLVDITNTATQATFNYDGSNRATLGVASNGFTTLTAVGAGAGWNLTGGNVGIGTGTVSAKLHVTATTEQLRVGYDAGNYASFTTSSGGDLTIAPSGSDLAITGNVDASGTLTAGTGDAFSVNSSGQVTAGTWQGSVIGGIYGGTGVNNGSNTITLGGNINTAAAFTTSGANALTLTTTGVTNVTLPTSGTLITSGVTTLSSLASIGTITTGVWNGTAITDTYVADTLTIDSSSSVHWNSLNNYPAACSAGSAISALADSPTCTAFNTDTSITLQDAYDATSGNTITTTNNRNIAITLAEVATPTSFTVENQDTAATSIQRLFSSIASGTATNGLLIEQTGAGTLTNGIQIAETSGTITDGILITGTLGNILNSGTIDITGGGAITGATGVTSSGTITFSGLGGGGTQCVNVDNSGVLGVTTCGGALTPWTSDIDADGFDLNDLSNILFRETTGAPTSADVGLYRDNSGDLSANVLTGKSFNIAVNGTDKYNFSSTGLAMNSTNITGLGTGITATAGLTITSTSANLAFATATSGNITFAPASTGSVQITSGVNTGTTTSAGLSIAANSLTSGTGVNISSTTATSGVLLNLASSSSAATTGQKGLNVDLTGALTGGQTTYGGYFSNTRTGATAVNVGVYATASGATGGNYAGIFEGNFIIGGANVTATNSSFAFGTADGGTLSASAIGAFAMGYVANGGSSTATIQASGQGSFSGGYSQSVFSSPDIISSGAGALAFGWTDSFDITASGPASLAFGSGVSGSGAVTASGNTSIAIGRNISATNTLSFALGSGFSNTNASTFQVGFSATPTLTVNSTALGIGTTAPDRPLEINSATGDGLRLTYNDSNGSATNYTDLQVSSAGALNILPSGFIANVGGGTTRTALRFLEPSGTGTDYAAIQANANVTTSYTWSLPAADASGCIQSNGSGALSIASCGSTFSGEVDDVTNDALTFTSDDASPPAGTVNSIYRDNTGDLNINTISGKTLNLQIAGTDKYNFSSTALAMNSNNITGLGTGITATAGLTITSTSANLAFATATSGNITFAPASTGSVQITSGVNTGTTTSAGLSIAANSLTTGTGLYMASSTLSSGSLVDLQVSGTAGASSQKVINAATTGTITGTQTTYGGFFSNTHSGGTSTNIALYATATSGTNNYAAIFDAGSVGIGTTGPDRKLDILDASNPQLRLTTTDGTVYTDVQNTANAMAVVSGSTFASSSAQQFGLQITPTINQTSSASYRALDVNVIETATTTSGLNRLADFRVSDSSKLAISNNGSITLQNASNLVTPYGGIGDFQNHLVRSEEFDNASWVKTNVTAPTANTQVGPDGSSSAESLATSSSGGDVCQWSGTAAASDTFTFSVWARSTSGTQNFDLRIDAGATSCATANNVTGTAVTHTATTSWQRFTVTQTFSSATGNVKARIFPGGTGGSGTIYAWAAQVDKSTRPSNYVLTTSGALTNTNRGQVIESNFATTSGFTYGGRHVSSLTGSIAASSTTVGQLIRVIDNASGTDDTATVRGLEVQSYSGTNINGINTAVAAFGYTFGVHAATTGQANEAAQPAAVFADLDNGSAATYGNAIRAYTDNATSADLVSFYQESSAFTGNGLEMNFGNNSGSFSGNFISLQKGGTQSFHVDDDGSTFVSFTGSGTAHAVCHATNGNTNDDELVDCTSGPSADYAEMYPVDSGIEAGDLVAVGTEMVNTYDALANGDGVDWNKVKGQITRLKKSTSSYQKNLIGIVSDNYADFSSTGYNIKPQDNPKSIALKGRVNVKVTNENGAIKAGDYITASATIPGYGMKATRSGQVVGQALADFNEDSGVVMAFVQVGFQSIGNTIVLDAPSINGTNLQSGNNNSLTNTASTFVIQQQTSGDEDTAEANILQLQTGNANRFMVSSSGATSILSNLNCEADADSCPSVLKVTQADTELMNIDARGTLTLAGTIVIKDDTFAGSVATDEDGLAEITFSYNLGTGKPVVQLTAEAQIPVFAQIVEFKQDEQGNYTGFVMKTFDLISGPIQAIVHYNVTGKQAGYITLGEAVVPDEELEFYNGDGGDSGEGVGLIIDGGEVVGNENDQNDGGSSSDNGSVSGDFTPNNPDDTINTDDGSGSEPASE